MAKTREICVVNHIYCQFSDLLEIFLSKAYHPFTYSFIRLCFQQTHFEALLVPYPHRVHHLECCLPCFCICAG